MINKEKTDAHLGKRVHEYLVSKGVETPMTEAVDNVSGLEKKSIIEDAFADIMYALGLDIKDDSLMETPRRVAKMYVDELYWGLDYDNFPKCTQIENKMGYDEMVIEKNITSMSSCEHHFLTIDGKAAIAYIPNKTVLGLSKMNRIVEYFSRRPQVQERLTEQIYHTLVYILDTEDVAVVVEGVHYCVKSRGVSDCSSLTTTSKLGGKFKHDPALRAEFLKLAKDGK